MKKNGKKRVRLLSVLRRYVSFFLLMAFIITNCMLLFLSQLQAAAGTAYTGEELHRAAVLTFGNVVLLSFLCTLVDAVRRRFMVERPVRQIAAATERIMKGDFSARIDTHSSLDRDDGFNEIIDCFNKMAEELAGIETLRTDFIANVSHELKTPLTVIQNYGTLLQQPGLEEEKRLEYARAITDTCRRLADLITNILKLNKLENQQIFPQREEFDLSEQLCGCLLQFENLWERKNIEIETELEEGVRIRADAELLGLVWNNLLSNAFKFTPEGGCVSLRLRADSESATVTVKDSGCGMSAEVGAHIFEKFYQGDPSHAAQGNGLGLALVKRVIDILHGQIQVESAPGRGSVFTVKIRR
ncbi:MAG: ATP-binding protein [Candidatus Limivicinus sp.]